MRIAGIALIVLSATATATCYFLATQKQSEAEQVENYWKQRQQEIDASHRRQGGGQPWFASRNLSVSTVQRLNDEAVQLYSYFNIAAVASAALIPLGVWLLFRGRRGKRVTLKSAARH